MSKQYQESHLEFHFTPGNFNFRVGISPTRLLLPEQFTNVFCMIPLMPEGAPQRFSWTPDLPLQPHDMVHAIQPWQQGIEMIPYHLQSLKGVHRKIVFIFRVRITDPFLVEPFPAADVLEDSIDGPAFVGVGPRALIGVQSFHDT